MLASNRILLISMVQHSRFSLSAAINAKNHYDSLGITPKATQSDIKAAYYKLSMQFHPDKNKGSDAASERFRSITEAYEVLGNYKLRKLYDKGILHTAGPQYADAHATVVEDDDQTKFYKSRAKRSQAPTPTGRTPIYDFDEWAQAHYGQSFARRAAAKEKFEMKEIKKASDIRDMEKEVVVFGLFLCFVVYIVFGFVTQETHDNPDVSDKVNPVLEDTVRVKS